MPELQELIKVIKLADGKNTIDKNRLKSYVGEYMKEASLNPSQAETFEIINKNIENSPDFQIAFRKIREISEDGKKTGSVKPKTINDFLFNGCMRKPIKKGIRFYFMAN